LCALLLPLGPLSAVAKTIPVIDFDTAVQTEQGGYYQCIGALPDRLRDALVTAGEPACGAWRLEVSADAPTSGAGGLIALFDRADQPDQPQMLDVHAAPSLRLRLIGDLGQRRLRVELVSGAHIAGKSAGSTVGVISAGDLDRQKWSDKTFAAEGEGLDVAALGAVRLTLEGEGPAWVALDAVDFTAADAAQGAACAPPAAEQPMRRALWVWRTTKYLADSGQVERLLKFCKEHAITDLFWQVPYNKFAGRKIELLQVDEQRRFNIAAHQAGIRVHALDGGPEFVLRENHERPIKLVEAVAAFNAAGPAEGRYFGVHMDNEPYVLKGWKEGPEKQQAIIQSYIELNRALSAQCKAAGMAYGVDIPFWWDRQEAGGERMFRVQSPEGDTPLLEALFPLVQNAGIMSYRVRALGANGVVDCCRTEFALGQRTGVDVFASVELGTGEKVETGITFGVYPAAYFQTQLDTLQRVLPRQAGCAGVAIHAYYSYLELLEK